MAQAKFVVLTSSRTGSTWLVDRLNMQAGVEAHGELFLDKSRTSPAMAGRDDQRRFIEVHQASGLARVPRVVSYLNTLYRSPRTVGFKLMYAQLRAYPEILPYLSLHRVRIVHLIRRNLIDVLISEELATITGASHVRAGTIADVPRVYLDPNTLIDRMRRRQRSSAKARCLIRVSTCPCLEVSYEALLEGNQEFGNICEFLEVPGATNNVNSSLKKRATRSHRNAIANYEEVRQVLHPTSYSDMLQ